MPPHCTRRGITRADALLGPALLCVLIGACGDPRTPTRMATEPSEPNESVPVAFSWLGSYTGLIDGVYRDSTFGDEPVTLEIFISQAPGCENSVAVRLDNVFDRCHLTFSSAVTADFQYVTDSVRHTLHLDRFSGGATANTILGLADKEEPDSQRRYVRVYRGDFLVTRQ